MKTAWYCTKRLKGYTEIAVILPINCRQIADKRQARDLQELSPTYNQPADFSHSINFPHGLFY